MRKQGTSNSIKIPFSTLAATLGTLPTVQVEITKRCARQLEGLLGVKLAESDEGETAETVVAGGTRPVATVE